MNSRLCLTAILAPALLGGCMTPSGDIDSPDPAFGEAVKYSMAVQVIDPEPVYDPEGAQPGDNGEVAAEAVERYRKGENLEQHKRESRIGISGSDSGAGAGAGAGVGSGPQ